MAKLAGLKNLTWTDLASLRLHLKDDRLSLWARERGASTRGRKPNSIRQI